MTKPDWGGFYLVQHGLKRQTDDDVRTAEAALGVQLPNGYRELMTTLGDGEISGILRVFSPAKLEAEQELFRELTQDVWFFNEPDETLTKDYALESIAIADSIDGDQVIFHPGTGRLHVLPRHDEHTYSVGTDLWDVVAWFQESGVLTRPHPFRYFESFAGPTEATNGQGRRGGFSQLAEAISSLGLHDAVETGDDECTFFVKAIGGYLSLQDPQASNVYAHFRYQPDRAADLRERIRQTAITTGVTFGAPWSMST
ncbi:SMI1/KNR4 family protein [Kribbella catacumbae]|uniref:SMI1/KNR4 family protein n=1 Tax=Kribbella catacumbae TaxID=460086 RepID=UPI00037E91FC|nr:SMI1/KNR4 family protein [Kribbella catacumbae]